jgi:Fuc2NAc and GlcNAc transferase
MGWGRCTLGWIIWNWGWVGQLAALVGLVWMINLYNFMDGIDGLAGWKLSAQAGWAVCSWRGAD